MWVVERVISTPATHAAHHGFSESDGVTHYHGNFGNFLFLWEERILSNYSTLILVNRLSCSCIKISQDDGRAFIIEERQF